MFSPEYDQLTSVDKDCTKDEEEVNEHPTGQGGYALGHLSYKGILGFHDFSGCQIYWSICHTLNKVPTQWHFLFLLIQQFQLWGWRPLERMIWLSLFLLIQHFQLWSCSPLERMIWLKREGPSMTGIGLPASPFYPVQSEIVTLNISLLF